MRVMMLGPFPRSRERVDGGVSAATMYLSEALARLPDVELVGVRLGGARVARGSAGDLGWPVVDLDLGRFAVSTFFRRQQRRLAALIGEFKPDLVHAQGADASGYLAVRSGRPAVVTIHGILVECARLQVGFRRRMRELAQASVTERYVVGRAPDVIAISPYVSRYYAARLRGSLHDVPNAVSPRYFSLHRRPEAGTLLFAGRISRGKGLIDLVRAVATGPVTIRRVVLAGSVPDPAFEDELRREIRRSGVAEQFELPGLLEEEALLREFSRAAALVLPSLQETAPMVIQQAMAAGLPVIATRVGGIPFQVEHGKSGLLYEAGNVAALAALLTEFMADPRLGEALSAAARQHAAERFSADRVALATRAVYESILRGRARTYSSK